MTTSTEKLTDQDRADIVRQARDFLKVRELSVTALARMIGVGASTLSEVLNSKYRGDPTDILQRVLPAINEFYRAEDSPGKGGFVRHAVARKIFTALKYASRERTIAAVYGPSGIGKTFSLLALQKLEFPSAIYIEVQDDCRQPRDLYAAIARHLNLRGGVLTGERGRGPSRGKLFAVLVDRLKDSGRLLIVDEADGLPMGAFNCLRQLHDATGCPILFAGRPNLNDRLDATRKREEIGGSLIGRIGMRIPLDNSGDIEDDDGSSICSVGEMAQMLKKFKVVFAPTAARWLCALAHYSALYAATLTEEGGLRMALNVAGMAAIAANGRTVTVELLRGALELLRGRRMAAALTADVEAYAERLAKAS